MKHTKKAVAFLLAACMLAALLVGCGGNTSNVKEPSTVSAGGNSAPADKGNEAAPKDTSVSASQEVTIPEGVLYDEGGIKITATGFNASSMFGPEIKLLLENNSNQSVTVQARNCSVNGYMVKTMLSSDIAPGKKANDTLTLMSSSLKTAGITTIADIEFSFHIFDSSTWDTVKDTGIITLTTSAASGYTYTFDNSGHEIYNSNGVEVVVKGLAEDGSWLGPCIVVYISNSGSRNITVQARNVSINGFMVDAIFSSDVVIGKHAVDTITFMTSDLQNNGIQTIEDVELSLHIFDMDSWNTIADTDPVKITF